MLKITAIDWTLEMGWEFQWSPFNVNYKKTCEHLLNYCVWKHTKKIRV